MRGKPNVIVVGGGIAGISAAVHLLDRGCRVRLLEQRRLLGGRAGSFAHALGAEGLLDNSQHVLLGCCSELQQLYQRLGVSDLIRFDKSIHFADIHGRTACMKAAPLPSPLHLGPALMGFGLLSSPQKWQIVQAMGQMLVAGTSGRDAVERISFGQYLRGLGQSQSTIDAYWDVICVSALNEPCDAASAKYGLQVFQEAFLARRRGYHLGYARRPLTRLYERLAGVELQVATSVRALLVRSGRVCGVQTAAGDDLLADHVVLATSASAAVGLLRPALALDERLASIGELRFRPILGAHLLYDRPVAIPAPVALVGTRLQWVFVDEQRPELIHGVVSAADLLPENVALPELFDGELRQVFPACLAEAALVDSVLVKEQHATFRPLPGVDRIRPSQRTHIPGLTLAGDYTRTDWPATMEGAARSGRLAADAISSKPIH